MPGRNLLAAFAVALALASPARSADRITLGYMTTLTGPGGIQGEEMINSFRLALEHLDNKIGGLLDEATEGLSPIVCESIWRALSELKSTGCAIFLVDKNLEVLRRLADHHYVLEKGRVCWSGDGRAFVSQAQVVEHHLGLG